MLFTLVNYRGLYADAVSLFFAVCIFLTFISGAELSPLKSRGSNPTVQMARAASDSNGSNNSIFKSRRFLDVAIRSDRIGETCSKEDIAVYQGATTPMTNGIPTYTVQIVNTCATGCSISGIHLSCGWFSSARMINPKIFKRIKYNDCLVNDGKMLKAGSSISFQYANTFRYPLAVASVDCNG